MIRKQTIASDSKSTRGVNAALVQLVADLVVDKVNGNQNVVEPNQEKEDDMVALANLSKIKPEIWKEIPKDVQQAIMKVRLEESKSQTKEGRSEEKPSREGTSSAPLLRQYSKPKENMVQMGSPTLDVVDEFLQQALGEDGNLEEAITSAFNVITVGNSTGNALIANCMNSIQIQDYEC